MCSKLGETSLHSTKYKVHSHPTPDIIQNLSIADAMQNPGCATVRKVYGHAGSGEWAVQA